MTDNFAKQKHSILLCYFASNIHDLVSFLCFIFKLRNLMCILYLILKWLKLQYLISYFHRLQEKEHAYTSF